jgi:aryl-alcohol dehydrogenase-like predicted oxidoreductase
MMSSSALAKLNQYLVPWLNSKRAWSPLAGGLLSGKYRSKKAAADARFSSEMMKEFLATGERIDRIVGTLERVSQQVGRSAAQVALAWLRYRETPVIPIIGARRISQLQDNLDSLTLDLDGEQLKELDAASTIELGFPGDLYGRELVKSLA